MTIDAREASKAGRALQDWFSSQDINVADANFICTYYIATFLTSNSIDKKMLNEGLEISIEAIKEWINLQMHILGGVLPNAEK